MIDQRIVDSFKVTKSVKETAAILGVSVVKGRRTLITAGLWSSKRSTAVCALLDKGLSVEEIAAQLRVTVKNVEAYAPYRKGAYGKETSTYSAERCKSYRSRNQSALAHQVLAAYPNSHAHNNKEVSSMHAYDSKDVAMRKTVHLHMELVDSKVVDDELGMLAEFGKVQESISRDILVPSSITLHSLHFAVQRAFGWQNSHLHHFELPEETYHKLTGGMFQRWGELCGIYFRMPTDDMEDLYWDDDYDGTKSFRTWLRKKYCGPYTYEGYSELYLECQKELLNFYTNYPRVDVRVPFETFLKNPSGNMIEKQISPKEATIAELERSLDFGGNLQSLLERLTIADVMYLGKKTTSPENIRHLIEAVPVTNELLYLYDYGDGWEVRITYVENSEEAIAHPEVASEEKPLCVMLDGLNVMDDVGGVSGYCNFLYTIHAAKTEDSSNLRAWAQMQGWSGRKQKPENIL